MWKRSTRPADPARAAAFRAPLLRQLEASGATRLLSANLGCRLHFANGTAVPVQRMALLANEPASDGVRIEASADAKALLIAGRPLNEPIAQYGPFVMNTTDEIYQALADFRDGRLGERAEV